MSVLNKLKELVSMIEEEVSEPKQEKEEQVEETPPLTEESEEISEEESEEISEEEPEELEEDLEEADLPEQVVCTGEESLAIRTLVKKEKEYFASLGEATLNFEKRKALFETHKNSILKDMKTNRSYYMEQLDLLRTQYNLPIKGYEILLPLSEEELLKFVKVDKKPQS